MANVFPLPLTVPKGSAAQAFNGEAYSSGKQMYVNVSEHSGLITYSMCCCKQGVKLHD